MYAKKIFDTISIIGMQGATTQRTTEAGTYWAEGALKPGPHARCGHHDCAAMTNSGSMQHVDTAESYPSDGTSQSSRCGSFQSRKKKHWL